MHGVTGRREPLAEDELVQRVEHQALRTAGRAGHGMHVGGTQAVCAQVRQRARSGVDVERACGHARAVI